MLYEMSDIMPVYSLGKKIKMNELELSCFKDATFLTTPIFHTDRDVVEMQIEVESLLPFAVYDVFRIKLLRVLQSELNMKISCRITEYDAVEINKYVKFICMKYNYLAVFMKAFPILENKTLSYRFANEELVHEAKKNSKQLETLLTQYGIQVEIQVSMLNLTSEVEVMKVKVQPQENRPVEVYKQEKKSFARKKVDNYMATPIKDLSEGLYEIKIEGKVFLKENNEMRNGKLRQNLYITDFEEAICIQRFERGSLTKEVLNEIDKGDYIVAYGSVEYNQYARDNVFKAVQISKIQENKRTDDAKVKRVELHTHTKYSEMDGLCDIKEYILQANAWGHDAIAVTDHSVIQAFPMAQEVVANINRGREKPFTMIYGVEMNMVDPHLHIVRNVQDRLLEKTEYCIFDLETTGLSCKYDYIIEFGGQIVKDRSTIRNKQMFFKPPIPLSNFTTELTGIRDSDVENAPFIEDCIDEILEFIGDRVLVAHNADFDVSFLNALLIKLGREPLSNPVIDTVALYRSVHAEKKGSNLGAAARFYGIKYEKGGAHRADYDANILVDVFLHMLNEIPQVKTLEALSKHYDASCFSKVFPKHVTLLAKNAAGMKEIFQLVSTSHIKYLSQKGKSGNTIVAEPRIPREEIERLRVNNNFLVGSSCQNNEVFEAAQTRGDDRVQELIDYYDYIEIQPLDCYSNLLARGSVPDQERLKLMLKTIVDCANKSNKIIVATGDVHYNDPNQKQLRDV